MRALRRRVDVSLVFGDLVVNSEKCRVVHGEKVDEEGACLVVGDQLWVLYVSITCSNAGEESLVLHLLRFAVLFDQPRDRLTRDGSVGAHVAATVEHLPRLSGKKRGPLGVLLEHFLAKDRFEWRQVGLGMEVRYVPLHCARPLTNGLGRCVRFLLRLHPRVTH